MVPTMNRRTILQASLLVPTLAMLSPGRVAQAAEVAAPFELPRSYAELKEVCNHFYWTNPSASDYVEKHVDLALEHGLEPEFRGRLQQFFVTGETWIGTRRLSRAGRNPAYGPHSILHPFLYRLYLDERYREAGITGEPPAINVNTNGPIFQKMLTARASAAVAYFKKGLVGEVLHEDRRLTSDFHKSLNPFTRKDFTGV